MDGSGALSNQMKQGSTSLAFGPLHHLKNQKLERERIKSIPQIGNLWILSNIIIPRCCPQFYKLGIDDKIKIGDHILRISHTWQATHLLCWMYVRDFYGRLCWRYVGRSDVNYNIRIDNNRKKTMDFEREEDVPTTKDLK